MMIVPFTKASACGNDFLIVEGAYAPANPCDFSRRICDRHNGVGADGVEWLLPVSDADMQARLINADGSEAEISGNGTRCVAAYMVANGGPAKVAIRTGAGVKQCQLTSRDGNHFEFEMDMGTPQVNDGFPVRMSFGEVQGTPVSMGNPHYVVFVPQFPGAWQAEAAEIGRQGAFQHGVNVEYVLVKGANEIEVRFFERGVGETQSSGTGSCAAAVAAVAAGRVHSPVHVQAPGGAQVVRWTGSNVFLRGPAQLVCRGEFFV
jgi:diaminopimelate epimerase